MRGVWIVVGCVLCCGCGESSQPRDAGESIDASPIVDARTADGELPLDAATDGGLDSRDAAPQPAPECDVVPPTVCPEPMPRYDDVRPIFAARCASCHNGSDGMWPLSSYQHVADWYGEIRAQMIACTMPPVDSGLTMPLQERMKILDWIRCGFPR